MQFKNLQKEGGLFMWAWRLLPGEDLNISSHQNILIVLYSCAYNTSNYLPAVTSDAQKMEKEQEAERQRDRNRITRLLDTKINICEPPPKVPVGQPAPCAT